MATFINQWSLLQAFVAKLANSSNLKIGKEKYINIQSNNMYVVCGFLIYFSLKLYKIGCVPLN